jgi:hypothetical protein
MISILVISLDKRPLPKAMEYFTDVFKWELRYMCANLSGHTEDIKEFYSRWYNRNSE